MLSVPLPKAPTKTTPPLVQLEPAPSTVTEPVAPAALPRTPLPPLLTAPTLRTVSEFHLGLDPADPINFAGHLTDPTKTLPNLLVAGTPLQAAKKILTQVAYCDNTVPNPFNLVYSSNIGVGPLPTGATFFDGSGGGTGTFQLFTGATFNPAKFADPCTATTPGTVPHGFLLIPGNALGALAQTAIANFVTTDLPQTRFQQ